MRLDTRVKKDEPCRARLIGFRLGSLLRVFGSSDLRLPELASDRRDCADDQRSDEQSTNHRNGGDEVHLHVVADSQVGHLRIPEAIGLFHRKLLL